MAFRFAVGSVVGAAAFMLPAGLALYGFGAYRAASGTPHAISGETLTRAGAADVEVLGRAIRLRMTCRGPCDDLTFTAAGQPRVKLSSAEGRAISDRSISWRRDSGGPAVLAITSGSP